MAVESAESFIERRRKELGQQTGGSTDSALSFIERRKKELRGLVKTEDQVRTQTVLKDTLNSVIPNKQMPSPIQTQAINPAPVTGIDFKAEQAKKQQTSAFEGKLPAASLIQTGQGIQSALKDKVPAANLIQQTGRGPANASQIPGISQYETTKQEIANDNAPGVVKAYANVMNEITQGNPLGRAVSRSFAGNSGATRRDSTGNAVVDKVTDAVNNLVTPFITPTGAPVGSGPNMAPYEAAGKVLNTKIGQQYTNYAANSLLNRGLIPNGSAEIADRVARNTITETIAGPLQNVASGLINGQDSNREIMTNAQLGVGAGLGLGFAGGVAGELLPRRINTDIERNTLNTPSKQPSGSSGSEVPLTREQTIYRKYLNDEPTTQEEMDFMLGPDWNDENLIVKQNPGTAEPQRQDVMTDLFGEQNLGISANKFDIAGQGPVSTEDQIVRRSIRNDKEGIAESAKAQVRAAYQDHVDALDPLKKLGQDVYDTAMDSNRANNVANTILNDKFVNLQGQVVGDSLKDIFKKISRGNDKKFLDFLNLRRATTRMSRNEKVFDDRLQMTPEKVQESINTLESRYPGFEAVSNDYYKFWENVRQMGVEEGLISADMKAALEASEPYYVPQMRQFSRSEKPGKAFLSKSSNKAFSGQKAPIQKLSEGGSGRPLVDARKSTMEAVGAWTNAVLRNRTLQPVVRALQENPDAFKGIVSMVDNTANVSKKSIGDINEIIQKDGIDGLIESFNNNFDLVMNKGKDINLDAENVLRVMVDGEPHYIKVEDPEIVKAAISMGPQATSLLTDVMGAMSNATKRGATGLLAPLFAVKGATMDLASSAIQARNPVKQAAYTVYSIFSGVGDALKIPGLRNWAQDYRRMGGGYSYAMKGDRAVNKSIDNITRYPVLSGRNALKTGKNIAKAPFKILDEIGNIAENAPRIAASRIELERLGNEITPANIRRAMNAGREATVNYSRKGLRTPEIEAFAPYSNAAVQGTRRVLKAFKDNPVRTTAAVGVIAVLPKLIEYSRFHDDEDYQNIPARERMRNTFVSKNADGSFVKVPLDPAYTSFGEMTIEGLRAFKDGDPTAFKGSMDALVNAWTPPLVTGILQGLTKGDGVKGSLSGVANATVFGPPSAIISNKSFTGAPIVSQALSDRSGRYQYDEKTSSIAKKIGELTNFSPVMADYIIKAYGGDAARIVLPLTSSVGQGNTRNTLLRNFITDPTFTNTLTDDFYDAKDKLNRAYADYNEAGAELPSWYNEDLRKSLNSTAKGSISKQLSGLRDQKKAVTTDKSLSDKQRTNQLREIQQQINNIYIEINSALQESGVIK